MAITLSNLNRFSKFFHGGFFRKFEVKLLLKIPPHLIFIATLPCEKEASCCWASADHANDVQPVSHGFGRRVEAGRYRPDLRWSRSKGERHLLPWRAPVTAAVAKDANSSSVWCTSGTASIRPSLGSPTLVGRLKLYCCTFFFLSFFLSFFFGSPTLVVTWSYTLCPIKKGAPTFVAITL